MKFSNLSIATRLGAGFGALIMTMLVVAFVGTLIVQRQAQTVVKTFEVDVQVSLHLLAARAELGNLRRFEKDMLLNLPDLAKVGGYQDKWRAARRKLDEHLNAAQALADGQAGRDAMQALAGILGAYDDGMNTLQAGMEKGTLKAPADGYRRAAEFEEVAHAADQQMERLFESSVKQVSGIKATLAEGERRRRANIGVGVVVGVLLAFGIAIFIARTITVPLRYAVQVAESLAKGDLTRSVEVRSKDEIGRLMHALQGTVGQLGGIIGRIKESSDKVGSASREIAQANLDLSTRTEEQASALEQTSASMQQMSVTVGQSAQNARSANQLAAQTAHVAAKGGEVVRDAVTTMNGIAEASRRIADITGVIDGIAFQTNLLALNAAVEAARAGDQGRGFAVVAAEVRGLAQRSADAAKEIKTLITDSVGRVDAGARQVNAAGRTMEEILAAVSKVNELVAAITKASEEQAQGIGQVTEAMTQLERVTQQNAAMVEEASAAAGSLQEQSRSMTGAVGVFLLTGAARGEPRWQTL